MRDEADRGYRRPGSLLLRIFPRTVKIYFLSFAEARTDSCRNITRKMSDSMDRRLTLRERSSVWFHSIVCEACVRYLAQIRQIRVAVNGEGDTGAADRDGLSDEAKNRITAAIRSARRS